MNLCCGISVRCWLLKTSPFAAVATNPASMETGMIPETMHQFEPIRLLRLREVADRLSISVATVRREIRSRRLKAVRIGRALRVNEAELANYIAARPKR